MECVECGSDFPRSTTARRQSNTCSPLCRKARKKKTMAAWVLRNADYVKAVQAEARKAHKAANPEYFRNYYAANKERRKAETRAWYRGNIEHHEAVRKAYVAARPEWARDVGRKHTATRRARTKDLFIEAIDHRVVFERDKGICGICSTPIGSSRWEVDHKVPLSKGGRHAYDNVQLAHRRCNRSKGAKDVGHAARGDQTHQHAASSRRGL